MVAFLIRALAIISDTLLIIIIAFASHIRFSSWTQKKQPSVNQMSILFVQVRKLGQGHFDLTKHIFGHSPANDDNVLSFYIQKVKGQFHCDIILSSKKNVVATVYHTAQEQHLDWCMEAYTRDAVLAAFVWN